MTKFKEWSQQEIFGDLMLQYDLSKAKDEFVIIPVQIIEFKSYEPTDEHQKWIQDNTEIEVLMTGDIIWEGIRHCFFSGYVNYPDIKNISLCLNKIHLLCIKYATDYVYE